jgi:hypothetical protein
VKSKKRGDLLD